LGATCSTRIGCFVNILTFSASGPGRFDAVAASLAELGVYLVPLAGLAVGCDAIVGPARSGALELLFSLPVPKGRVVVGSVLAEANLPVAVVVLAPVAWSGGPVALAARLVARRRL
jgi:ABC-type transport system involved in multi-copper enzyme maturation permease subunit